MENELIFLETRVTALIARLSELNSLNEQLRSSLQKIQEENADLKVFISNAIERIETLMGQLPDMGDE